MTCDTAEIHIYGPNSLIKNYPSNCKSLIRLATSYPVEGHQFSKAFRHGKWDGRKHLFRPRTGAFPTGLVNSVRSVLEAHKVIVDVIDHREIPEPTEAGFVLNGVSFTGKYSYQQDACEKMIEAKQGIVKVATGGGKTEIACAVTQYLGLSTLFIVGTRELLYQAQKRFMLRLGKSQNEIGIIGDGHWKPGSWVTIATLATLESRINTPECQELLKSTEVMFIDECHRTGSKTWFTVATLCNAYYRYGLSGTPLDRTDGANLRLIAVTGEKIVDIPNKVLVELGITAKAHIIFDKITTPVLKKNIRYNTAYKQGVSENPELLQHVIDWTKIFYDLGLGTLILTEEIAHGKLIDDALWTKTDGMFIPHQYIYGEENSDIRTKALADFADGNLPVLIASTILDEGVDVPTIDALVLAGSRKSRIRTMQRLGRGLRGSKLVVVEFSNFCHRHLINHSLNRMEDYKSEECFPIYSSGPDKALVEKIWNEAYK